MTASAQTSTRPAERDTSLRYEHAQRDFRWLSECARHILEFGENVSKNSGATDAEVKEVIGRMYPGLSALINICMESGLTDLQQHLYEAREKLALPRPPNTAS